MSKIETDTKITIYADHEFRYETCVSDEFLSVSYLGNDGSIEITFASMKQMEAVAKAMLRAIETHFGVKYE